MVRRIFLRWNGGARMKSTMEMLIKVDGPPVQASTQKGISSFR